jgi:hypothetical protein
MKIVVYGHTGMVGSRVAAELEQRGHSVQGASRATGADIRDPASVMQTLADAEAVVSAVSARSGDYTLVDVAHAITTGAREAGVKRVVVVGGAGSLETGSGARVVDSPDFPDEWKPEALQQSDALEVYRGVDDLEWTYVSPAAAIQPGTRTGAYRTGGDQLLIDGEGNSQISAEDYAVAIADLLERGDHARERITVAW